MKFLSTLIFVLHILAGFSQGVDVPEARSLYFSMGKNPAAVLSLNKMMNAGNQRFIPVLLAYKGASSAASAAQVSGVYAKLSYFKQGKSDLEQAVRLDPKDPEIRFLRLATQTNAPGFLLYKGDIREDKKIVLQGLPILLADVTRRALALDMVRFLLAFPSLSAREKQIVNQLRLHYE